MIKNLRFFYSRRCARVSIAILTFVVFRALGNESQNTLDLVEKITLEIHLTPKGPNTVFWQHSDLGQLTTSRIFNFCL